MRMAKKEWIHSPKILPAPLTSEKKIIALTNSSTQAPPKKSNSPEMGHLSKNGVEKESPKIRTVIN